MLKVDWKTTYNEKLSDDELIAVAKALFINTEEKAENVIEAVDMYSRNLWEYLYNNKLTEEWVGRLSELLKRIDNIRIELLKEEIHATLQHS